MFNNSNSPIQHVQQTLDNYAYGHDPVMDIFYKKYQTLEAIITLLKGEHARTESTDIRNVPSPILFEYEEFLKTDNGKQIIEKWFNHFAFTLGNIEMFVIRYIVFKEEFNGHDLLIMFDTIDIAINNITRNTIIHEKQSRTLP